MEPADEASLRRLYEEDQVEPPTSLMASFSLLGKLAGAVVGHLVAAPAGDRIEITHLYVSQPLRRKRIGRGMLRRLEELAGRMQYRHLAAGPGFPCGAYLMRAGFEDSGSGLEKRIESGPPDGERQENELKS